MHTRLLRAVLALTVLLAPGFAFAQAAGRVLLSIGDVTVERGGQTQPLAFNAPVQAGDTIRLGANSNAQIRMTDESILGLRERTVFRIDEYQYAQGTGRSVFSLLAGGIRTVTGAIGRLKQDQAYAVRTPTSTIGIRGTHYTVVFCNNDCGSTGTASLQVASAGDLRDLGPLAQAGPGSGTGIANGTYGGVSDGRLNVSPLNAQQLGREFGNDEFFFQANANSAPQALIAPPSFLYDRLSGQQRSQGQQQSSSSEGSGQAIARGGINSESRPSTVPAAPAPSTFVVTELKTQTGTATVVPSTADTAILGGWATPGNFNDLVGGGALISKSGLAFDSAGRLTGFTVPSGCIGPNDECTQGVSASSLPSALESGSATFPNSTEKVFWGRWNSGTLNDGGKLITLSSTTQAHLMYAPLTPQDTIAAKTGSLTLKSTYPGGYGTTLTNNLGATPISGTFPTLTIDFSARSVAASSSSVTFNSAGTGTQSWSFGSGTGSIQLSGGGAFFRVDGTGTCTSSGTACNGTSSATAKGGIAGIFIGPAGDHAGVAVSGAAGSAQFTGVRVYCVSGC